MKQPELGKKIVELRKQLNLTQEELVDKCNVNVRTLQRIEAGEVTPRLSTLRVITEALELDFDEVFGSIEKPAFFESLFVINLSKEQLYQLLHSTWIAGIIYFALGIMEAAADYLLIKETMSVSEQFFVAVTNILALISYAFFMRGFIAIGKMYSNYLLTISSYLMVACYIFLVAFDVTHVFTFFDEAFYLFVQASASVLFGAIGVLYGIALIRLKEHVGTLGLVAGVFELMAAFFFITVFGAYLGLVLLIPAVIVEVVILYKVSEVGGKKTVITST